jgi:hypothetical protein
MENYTSYFDEASSIYGKHQLMTWIQSPKNFSLCNESSVSSSFFFQNVPKHEANFTNPWIQSPENFSLCNESSVSLFFFRMFQSTKQTLPTLCYNIIKGIYFVGSQCIFVPVFITLHILLWPLKFLQPSTYWTIDVHLFKAAVGIVSSWFYTDGVISTYLKCFL